MKQILVYIYFCKTLKFKNWDWKRRELKSSQKAKNVSHSIESIQNRFFFLHTFHSQTDSINKKKQ